MTDAERLHATALLIRASADDPDKVRDLASLLAGVLAAIVAAEAAADALPPVAGRPSRAAIARCGRRAEG